MKISKSYNHRNGVTYVYEVLENHWNPEKKRGEPVRKLIGKWDPVTETIIPTGKRGRPRKKSTPDTSISSDAGSTPSPIAEAQNLPNVSSPVRSDSGSPDYKTLYESARAQLLEKDQRILQLEDRLSQFEKVWSNIMSDLSAVTDFNKGVRHEPKRSEQSP